jgi:hypothetical protein
VRRLDIDAGRRCADRPSQESGTAGFSVAVSKPVGAVGGLDNAAPGLPRGKAGRRRGAMTAAVAIAMTATGVANAGTACPP